MSANALIGAALAATAPAFLLWTLLSFRVWIALGRDARPGNYRLAVSSFLLMTTLFVANAIRIRAHLQLGPWGPRFSDWPTGVLDVVWAITVWWGTVVLYGHDMRDGWRWLRDRPAPPEPDPYLDNDGVDRSIRRQARRTLVVTRRYQQLAAEADAILRRIERDDALLLPKDGERKEWSCM